MHTCLLLLLGLLGAQARLEYLTADNFTLSLQPDSKDWLIFYTHPEAGLADLESTFLTVSEYEKVPKLNYVLIDCLVQASLCEEQQATSYPTLRHHWNKQISDYDWALTADDFFEFGYKLSLPAVLQLQRREVFDRFKRVYDMSFMMWFYPNEFEDSWKEVGQTFDKVALDYRTSHIYFGRAARVEYREEEGIEFNDLPIVKQYGVDEAYEYSVPHFTESSLREFVENYKYTMLTTLTQSLWKEFVKNTQDKVVVIALIDTASPEQVVKYYNNLKAIGWDLRTHKNFEYQLAYVDVVKEAALPELLGVTSVPALVAVQQGTVYSLDIQLDSTDIFLSQIQEALTAPRESKGSEAKTKSEAESKGEVGSEAESKGEVRSEADTKSEAPRARVIKTEL
jgi:hypothetical protein